MVAKRRVDRKGQSLLEFLVTLPLMVGLAMILIRVNTAIQVSIVSQQHARAQTLHLAMNSSNYPRLDLVDGMGKIKNNQMILGVAENIVKAAGNNRPEASRQVISSKPKGANEPGDQEPDQTPVVRVRTTVSLCTQSWVIRANGNYVPLTNANLNEGTKPQDYVFCKYGSHQGIEPKI